MTDDERRLAFANGVMQTLWRNMNTAPGIEPWDLWLTLALAARMAERVARYACECGGEPPEQHQQVAERLARLLVLCDKQADATEAELKGMLS